MSDTTDKNEIIQGIKEEKVELIDLMLSDLSGRLKSVTISPREMEDCLYNGKWFDGSSIEGFTRIHESDMLLISDVSTCILLAWPRDQKKVARMICDVYEPDRTPFAARITCNNGIRY